MARPRLPTAVKEMTGAFIKHPERRPKAEPKPPAGLGPAPRRLSPAQRECWDELVDQAAAGVLTKSDRTIVELAARLMAELWSAAEIAPAKAARLESALGRLGLTPADRSRVIVAEGGKEDSPWDRLTAQ